MASALHRTTKQYLESVNTPDYDVADWIINPDLAAVDGISTKYWKITGDSVSEMTPEEKDDPKVLNRSRIRRVAQGSGSDEREVRELII